MKVIGWKAWYRLPGGLISRYRSDQVDWDHLPTTGAQVFVIYYDEEFIPDRPRRDFMYGRDFYSIQGDPDVQDSYVQGDVQFFNAVAGRTVSDEEFQECYDEAWDDNTF